MTNGNVRVRVAPSPTGDPHVGTAYQALFNLAFARSRGGRFVLRIEDTDRVRSSSASEAAIFRSLRWLGLEWDEGPDVGGAHGPYRQSERLEIYREHAERLLASGHAYRCFATKQELDEMRAKGGGYDRRYRDLDPNESKRRAETGEEHVLRLKIPLEGECVMHDLLRGEIRKDWASVDDQVLMKSDGYPTYHLANVVDDHLMGISHVIRGEEWINSLPKHLVLYEAFGWQPPVFCHLPLLRNDDPNRSKLSKRKNPTSIDYYRAAGYLPAALVNFLGLMGWAPDEGEEKFTLASMCERFRLEDVSLGGPIFDVKKLRWLNGRYIREEHDPRGLVGALRSWGYDEERLARIMELAQPRLETLADFAPLANFFFQDELDFEPGDAQVKGLDEEALLRLVQLATWRLDDLRTWEAGELEATIKELAQRLELKVRDIVRPLYVLLTGRPAATPLYQSMEILGPDMCRVRLRRGLNRLGGVSSKKLKQYEKDYVALFGPRAS